MAVFEYIVTVRDRVYCCHVLQCWLVIKETRRVIKEGHKTKKVFLSSYLIEYGFSAIAQFFFKNNTDLNLQNTET